MKMGALRHGLMVAALALAGCAAVPIPPTPEFVPDDQVALRSFEGGTYTVSLYSTDGVRRHPPRPHSRTGDNWIEFIPADTRIVELKYMNIGTVHGVFELAANFTGGRSCLIRGRFGAGPPDIQRYAILVWIEDEVSGEVVSERVAVWSVSQQRN